MIEFEDERVVLVWLNSHVEVQVADLTWNVGQSAVPFEGIGLSEMKC